VSVEAAVLRVEPHHVFIGKYCVPVGHVTAVQIYQEKPVVRVCCVAGAMGRMGLVDIDFQLGSVERVKDFVRGLLRETEAYFLLVSKLKTAVLRTDEAFSVQAEFTFSSSLQARIFGEYLAPICFPVRKIGVKGRTVTLLSNQGAEAVIVDQMKKAFAALNRHTRGTVHNALSLDCESPFKVPPVHQLYVGEPIAYFRRYAFYVIGPERAYKETGVDKYAMLTVNAEGARKVADRLVDGLGEITDTYPDVKDRLQPMLDLITPLTKEGWNEIDMEVFRNRFKNFPDLNFDDLSVENREGASRMLNQLLSTS
jgi:hypothetical protein